MKQPATMLWVCLLSIASFGIAGVSHAAEAPVDASTGEAVSLSSAADDPIVATLHGAQYAIDWESLTARQALTGEEKLLILSLSLQNTGEAATSIDPKSISVTALDSSGRGHDSVLGFRLPDSTEPANSALLPGVTLRFDAGIVVPGSANISAVFVRDTRRNRGAGVRIAVSVAATLPGVVSSDGSTTNPMITGERNTWLPLGMTSVRLESISRQAESLLNARPDAEESLVIAHMTVRNRSADELRLHRGHFRNTRLATEAGDRNPLLLLLETRDQTADFPMLPDQEVPVRMVFLLPAEAAASRIDLVETLGGRGGELSRRVLIDLDGGDSGPALVAANQAGIPSVPPGARPHNPGTQQEGFANAEPHVLGVPVSPSQPEPTAQTTDDNSSDGTAPLIDSAPQPGTTTAWRDTERLASVPSATTLTPGITGPLTGVEQTLQLSPGQEIEVETVEIDDVMYVVRLRSLRVEQAQESSGDDPLLLVMTLKGRMGETNDSTMMRRSSVGPDNWGDDGTQRSFAGNPLERIEYAPVRPYELMGYVVIGFEKDESSGTERDRLRNRIYDRFRSAWQSELSRQRGNDYNDFRPSNRDAIVAQFSELALRLNAEFNRVAREVVNGFDWSSGDSDEYFNIHSLFWINVDDAGNPGVLPRATGHFGRDPDVFPTEEPFLRRFFGNEGHTIGAPTAYANGGGIRWLLEMQITKENTYGN